jgi:hypothetical protein
VPVEQLRIVRLAHRLVVGELVGVGVDEQLPGEGRAAVVPAPQRYRRGQVPAGAVAADLGSAPISAACPATHRTAA